MPFRLLLDGEPHEIEIVRRRPHLVVRIDGREHEIAVAGTAAHGEQTIEIDGDAVGFARAHARERQLLRINGRSFEAKLVDRRSEDGAAGSGLNHVKAPMPGAVIAVHKSVGEAVKRGETVVTIESMKLQMALPAPRDGIIATILRVQGEMFDKDEVIATLEADLGEG